MRLDFLPTRNSRNAIAGAASERMKAALYLSLEKLGLQPVNIEIDMGTDSVKVLINLKVQNIEKLMILSS
jgi:hypothetical protein